jgi:hypothetical protein
VTAEYHPDYAFQVAFNASPNDPNDVPIWTNLTEFLLRADAITRGRQYELDQNQANQPSFDLDDLDESLNPGNTNSSLYPDVLPMRELVWQCQYPNDGSTGNLLNLAGQDGGQDPTFDSYTDGSTPVWISGVGSSSPVITATPT